MPTYSNPTEYTILNGGLTQTTPVTDIDTIYKIIGTAGAMASDNTFGHIGTLYDGLTYEYDYQALATYAGGVVKFHGVSMTATQALKNHRVIATYNGSAWEVQFIPDMSEDGIIEAAKLATDSVITAKILDLNVTTAKINDAAVTNAKLANMATNTIKGNDSAGPDVPQDLTMSELRTLLAQKLVLAGDVTSPSTTSSAAGTITSTTTIANDAVTTVKVLDDAITVAKVENNLTYNLIVLDVSFEAAGGTTPSVGDFKIKMPYPGTVSEIYAYAVKAIAATDNGTIVAKNNAGTTMTSGTITYTASDARGTAYTVTPSANNTFVAGDILTFTTAKATAGGLVQLSIKVTRS